MLSNRASPARNRPTAAWKSRDAREFAIDQMRRARVEAEIAMRQHGAARRASLHKDATLGRYLEAGRQRDEAIERATTNKVEQIMMREIRVSSAASERERDRRVKVAKAQLVREREKLAIAEANKAEDERRLKALARIQEDETDARSRLALEITHHAQAGERRAASVAKKRQEDARERAAMLEVQLQRAQSAKSLKEAWAAEQTQVSALARQHQSEHRVAKAMEARAKDHEKVARRNAEAEARRQEALVKIQKQEQDERHKLAGEIVKARRAGEARLAVVAKLREATATERAAATAQQLQRAAVEKMKKEQMVQREIEDKARARERERRRRLAHAQAVKEQQRLYFAERNAAEEARYEQRSLANFENAMAEDASLGWRSSDRLTSSFASAPGAHSYSGGEGGGLAGALRPSSAALLRPSRSADALMGAALSEP